MKPERIFTAMKERNSYSYRKTSEALEIYNFFLEYMAPDYRMKTIFKMKTQSVSYEDIANYLDITLEEVTRIHKSSYELLANVFISLEMDDYIQKNKLFDDDDNEYLFKKAYHKVLRLQSEINYNAKKKKQRAEKNSKRLFGDLL